jgi:uncharacterized membrane protein
MRNRNVGFLIIGIAFVIVVIIFIFNQGLREIVSTTCSHGPSCTMYSTINTQTYISFSVVALVFIIGLFLVFSKEQKMPKIIVKKIKDKQKKLDLERLGSDEKSVIKILQEEKGVIFQSSLMERLGCGKVKITRLLDKLEAKQLIERKRRGMNNIVVLKQ